MYGKDIPRDRVCLLKSVNLLALISLTIPLVSCQAVDDGLASISRDTGVTFARSAQQACQPQIMAELAGRGITLAAVARATTAPRMHLRQDRNAVLKAYVTRIDFKRCPGQLYLKFSPHCRPTTAFTRGACSGLSDGGYWRSGADAAANATGLVQ
jgi:hypothetical protein